MAAVWPDRAVEEANLVQNIAVVRRALGVEQGQPGHIETVPGHGYRLVGAVEALEEEPALELPQAPSRAREFRRLVWAVPLATVNVAVLWLARTWWPGAGLPEFRRIPVTRLAGKEFHPAISPDGTAVAADGISYLGSPGNLPDRQVVFFLEFATGRKRLIIEYPEPLPPIGAGPFSLSPDGRHLLAVRAEAANSDIVRVKPFW